MSPVHPTCGNRIGQMFKTLIKKKDVCKQFQDRPESSWKRFCGQWLTVSLCGTKFKDRFIELMHLLSYDRWNDSKLPKMWILSCYRAETFRILRLWHCPDFMCFVLLVLVIWDTSLSGSSLSWWYTDRWSWCLMQFLYTYLYLLGQCIVVQLQVDFILINLIWSFMSTIIFWWIIYLYMQITHTLIILMSGFIYWQLLLNGWLDIDMYTCISGCGFTGILFFHES